MNPAPFPWLLLVVSLPTQSATARMRIWRSLKSLGCGLLRDGAYLLPERPDLLQALRALSDETVREGGSAWLLTVQARSDEENAAFTLLFDRAGEYSAWQLGLSEARATLADLGAQEITRLMRKLRRDYEALRACDYFPSDASRQAEAAWVDFVRAADRLLSPDEPQAGSHDISVLDVSDYQGRVWATRRRLWVDRVACAWLIQRFIDRSASFLWLQAPADCPPDALGFDFDGAAFTHVGERVSFEVLLASFELDRDPGLRRLGELVHVLDVGSGFVPEAGGFEAMLAGARQRQLDDDQLLSEIGALLDSLYAHFSHSNLSQ